MSLMLILLAGLAGAETRDFDAQKLAKLAVENTSGKIVVSTTNEAKATIDYDKKKFGRDCKMSVDMKDGTLVAIVARGGGIQVKEDCVVDFRIRVPKKTNVDLKVGSGSIATSGTEGELDCRIGSGTLKAEGAFTTVKCDSGSGGLEIDGIKGPAQLAAGSGPVRARFIEVPGKGELDVRTGSGNATVILPKGAKVQTELFSGSGSVHDDVGHDPKARYRISMRAGAGDLSLKAE